MKDADKGGVIVTAAARGTGLAVEQSAARNGYGVVIGDIDEAAGTKAKQFIQTSGGRTIFCKVDATDRSSVAAAVTACETEFCFLHGMVNNAGFNRPMPFLETTEENWSQIMAVNGLGVLIDMQEAGEAMIATGHKGKIISTASKAGRAGFGDFAPYCASKASVISLIQAAAKALAPHGITVNAFAPGVVETDLWVTLDRDPMEMGATSALSQAIKDFTAGIPLGRASRPENISGTVDFLLSPSSDYMTGQCLMIDGGMIMQ